MPTAQVYLTQVYPHTGSAFLIPRCALVVAMMTIRTTCENNLLFEPSLRRFPVL